MKNYNFRVKYRESEDALRDIYKLFNYDNSDLTFKFCLTVLGPIVFIFMCVYGGYLNNSPGEVALFVLKYIVVWAIVFVIAMIINRTLWHKVLSVTAYGNAEEEYQYRMSQNGKEILTEIYFSEDGFYTKNSLDSNQRDYTYDRIIKILECEDSFALVLKSPAYRFGGPRKLIGFPKNALVEGNMDIMKTFLLEHCPNVKHGIKKFK